jgi:hypothetical protein
MAQEPYVPYPTAEPTGPARQYENISPNPADFGGLIGQAAQKLGGAVENAGAAAGDVAMHYQLQQNQIVANDAFNKYQNQLLNLTQGDPNDRSGPNGTPKPGYLALQGQAALTAQPAVEAAVEQARQSIASGLNRAQQIQFAESSRRLQMYTLDSIRSHFIRQQNIYGQSVNVAGQQTAERAIGANAGDITPEAEQNFNNNRADWLLHAYQEVQLQGNAGDPKIVANALEMANQKAIVARVQAIEAKDPINGAQKAATWLDTGVLPVLPGMPGDPQKPSLVKDHLEPSVLNQLESHLKGVQEGQDINSFVNGPAPAPLAGPRAANPEVSGAIGPAAARIGMPEDQARTIAQIESGTGANMGARNNPYQLGDAEKISVGMHPGDSLTEQTNKGVVFLKQAYDVASQTVGYPAQGWQTYVVHQQGVKGGPVLLQADPNANAANALAAAGVPHALANITSNGGTADMTVGQFLQHWQDVYARKAREAGVSGTTMSSTDAMAMLRTRGFSIAPPPTRYSNNFSAAMSTLNMTPQEQNLYQHHLDNLSGDGKVTQPNGDISTVLQAVVGHDGLFYNIPLVWDGKTLSPDDAAKRAGAQGWQNWPAYATADAADARYAQMHNFMEKDTANFIRQQSDSAPAVAALQPAGYTPAAGGSVPPQQSAATMPTSPLHTPQAYGMLAQRYAEKEAEAAQRWPGNLAMQHRAMEAVKQDMQFNIMLQQHSIAEAQRAQKENLDTAANDVITSLYSSLASGSNAPPFDAGKMIFNNPALAGPGGGEVKKTLTEFAEHQMQQAGKGPLYGYSPGFTKAYHDILDPTSPDHINNLGDLVKRGTPNGGDLPLNEIKELSGIYTASHKDPDKQSSNVIADGLQHYAKDHLLFQGATPSDQPLPYGMGLRDPVGEDLYNSQFLPKFRRGLDAAMNTGDQSKVDAYLSRDNVDKMLQGLRTTSQMAKDRLAALGETSATQPEKPGTPLPPAPKGATQHGWEVLMDQLPTSNGKTWQHSAWAGVLGQLLQDANDPKEHDGAIQDFNAKFGRNMGLDAQHVIDTLRGTATAAQPGAPNATTTAAASARGYTPREPINRPTRPDAPLW